MTVNTRRNHFFLSFINDVFVDLPSAANLSYFWNFGSLLGVCLVLQVLTGVFLAMHYCPDEVLAFSSVAFLTQESFVLRFWHANGTSMFFLCAYLHIAKGLYYGGFHKILVWHLGIFLYVLMMATAFIGYVLPWGQMSFWAATVITNLLSAIPYFGGDIVLWVWGGFSVSNATLSRFFSLHYLLPFLLIALAGLHILALHSSGSSNPIGVRSDVSRVPFHPYYVWKDLFGLSLSLFLIISLVFFYPYWLGDAENFKEANPLVTPVHIQPEWYLLYAYAILRSIPNKIGGVCALVASFSILFFVPLLQSNPVRSLAFRPLSRVFFLFFLGNFLFLTWVGGLPVEEPYIVLGQLSASLYFIYFLVLSPLAGFIEDFSLHSLVWQSALFVSEWH